MTVTKMPFIDGAAQTTLAASAVVSHPGELLTTCAGLTELVVLQSTPFCNLDCTYCYLPGRMQTGTMALTTVRRIAEELRDTGLLSRRSRFIWHAGEPLAAPAEFYERACDAIQEILGYAPTYVIQTNATLLNEKWCELFVRRRFRVGVSLDGPADLHDAVRLSRAGAGTHAATMRGVRLLQSRGIQVAVIAVLRAESLMHAERIATFFAENELMDIAFNIEEVEGVHVTSTLSAALAAEYAEFMKTILEWRRRSGIAMKIRELDRTLGRILYATRGVRSICNQPLRVVTFDWTGNFSTFSPELLTMHHPTLGRMFFGNVTETPLREIVRSDRFVAATAEIAAGVDHCRAECDYFRVCGGGYPSNKLAERKSFSVTETMECRLRVKATCDMLLDYVEGAVTSAH